MADYQMSLKLGNKIIRIPVLPEKLAVKSPGKNETATVLEMGEINIIRKRGLREISWSGLFPLHAAPYVTDRIQLDPMTYINDIQDFRKKATMVFQDPYSSLNPRMTVADIIGEPLDVHKLYSTKAERNERILELMDHVGLNSEHASRYAHEFSGGQRQRIGIARALAVNPEFIVCDEPVSALDVSIQAQVVNMFEDLQQEMGLTYLFIAHDLSVVKHISNRIGVMYLGKLVELADSFELIAHSVHPYTRSLLSAIPLPNPVVEKRRVAETYDYATSGIDYNKGTDHHVSGSHYVKCTDEEFAKWCK